MSLSRNPWHIREYLADELKSLAGKIFNSVEMKGITGNDKVMKYYEDNKRSVERITRWDIFNLQYHLPASILRVPYEILNRWNRNRLQTDNNTLVSDISHQDYLVTEKADDALDLLMIVRKQILRFNQFNSLSLERHPNNIPHQVGKSLFIGRPLSEIASMFITDNSDHHPIGINWDVKHTNAFKQNLKTIAS